MNDWQAIGAILRDCRKRAGLTQEVMAEQLLMDQGLVSKIENGQVPPRFDAVLRWSDVTNSREYLATSIAGDKWVKVVQAKVAIEKIMPIMKDVWSEDEVESH